MRWWILGLLVLSVAGCAHRQRDLIVWHKDGVVADDYQAAAYECERDTRMVAPTFGRGILIPAAEARDFAIRCMNSKGYYLAAVSTPGSQRTDTTTVTCLPKGGAEPVRILASSCADLGGVVLSAGGPARPTTYSRGIAYDVNERVACREKGASPSAPTVAMLAGPCVNGGGAIVGRAS